MKQHTEGQIHRINGSVYVCYPATLQEQYQEKTLRDAAPDLLRELEHTLYRAELPDDHVRLFRHSTVTKLHLSAHEMAEMKAEILYTRIKILELAQQIFEIRFDGDVPEWVFTELAILKRQAQSLFGAVGIKSEAEEQLA